MSPALVHLVPGPEPHGVVRHGLLVHPPGAELVRCERLDELEAGSLTGRVVVAQLTDRVIAGSAADGLEVWRRATAGVARLTVVLHDLPQRSDGRSRYINIGSGDWDSRGRPSEVRLDRVIRIDDRAVRREGAIIPMQLFSQIVAEVRTDG